MENEELMYLYRCIVRSVKRLYRIRRFSNTSRVAEFWMAVEVPIIKEMYR